MPPARRAPVQREPAPQPVAHRSEDREGQGTPGDYQQTTITRTIAAFTPQLSDKHAANSGSDIPREQCPACIGLSMYNHKRRAPNAVLARTVFLYSLVGIDDLLTYPV